MSIATTAAALALTVATFFAPAAQASPEQAVAPSDAVSAAENCAPWVTLRAPRAEGSVTWSAIATDPEGDEDLAYHWDFGDGAVATTQTVDHRFEDDGPHEVVLTVFDSAGAMTVVRKTAQAGGPSLAAK